MSQAIKSTMQTKGWQDIEKMLTDEIVANKTDIVTDKTDYQTIAIQTIARKEAGNIVAKVLTRLNQIKNSKPIDKQSYK